MVQWARAKGRTSHIARLAKAAGGTYFEKSREFPECEKGVDDQQQFDGETTSIPVKPFIPSDLKQLKSKFLSDLLGAGR